MRKIIYESNKLKVYQDGDKYEIFTVSTRNYDGIVDTGWTLNTTYTNVYCRDSFGRTQTWPQYNRHNDPDYSNKMAMRWIENN